MRRWRGGTACSQTLLRAFILLRSLHACVSCALFAHWMRQACRTNRCSQQGHSDTPCSRAHHVRCPSDSPARLVCLFNRARTSSSTAAAAADVGLSISLGPPPAPTRCHHRRQQRHCRQPGRRLCSSPGGRHHQRLPGMGAAVGCEPHTDSTRQPHPCWGKRAGRAACDAARGPTLPPPCCVLNF